MKIILSALMMTLCIACGKPPCDVLNDECGACTNAAAKTACSATVATYKLVGAQSSCQAVVDAKTYAADSAVCKAAN
jgi:hypothetical protein